MKNYLIQDNKLLEYNNTPLYKEVEDYGFRPKSAMSNQTDVQCLEIDSEDSVYVGGGYYADTFGYGQFTLFKLTSDGALDTSFPSGSYVEWSQITSLKLDENRGYLYAGGEFTNYNSLSSPKFVRINLSNATKDTSFNTGTGFNGNVRAIDIDSSGRVYVGGEFTAIDGSTFNRICRLNSDGTKDPTFVVGAGFNGVVRTIAVDNNGKIYVGGEFTDYDGSTLNRICRLNADGTQDTSFIVGTGFNDYVRRIKIDASNNAICGGNHTSYNGTACSRITKILEDGTLDTSFTQTPLDNIVYDLDIDQDKRIVATGVFTNVPGGVSQSIIRLSDKGITDSDFIAASTPGMPSGFNYAIKADSLNRIVVGGTLKTYKGLFYTPGFVRIKENGGIDTKPSGF